VHVLGIEVRKVKFNDSFACFDRAMTKTTKKATQTKKTKKPKATKKQQNPKQSNLFRKALETQIKS
jgi:hypothetical protein